MQSITAAPGELQAFIPVTPPVIESVLENKIEAFVTITEGLGQYEDESRSEGSQQEKENDTATTSALARSFLFRSRPDLTQKEAFELSYQRAVAINQHWGGHPPRVGKRFC